MRESKVTRSQIAGILNEAEVGMAVAEVTRKHGISAATFYAWRSRYGCMRVSDLQRLRELEQENARLRRPRAHASRAAGTTRNSSSACACSAGGPANALRVARPIG